MLRDSVMWKCHYDGDDSGCGFEMIFEMLVDVMCFDVMSRLMKLDVRCDFMLLWCWLKWCLVIYCFTDIRQRTVLLNRWLTDFLTHPQRGYWFTVCVFTTDELGLAGFERRCYLYCFCKQGVYVVFYFQTGSFFKAIVMCVFRIWIVMFDLVM